MIEFGAAQTQEIRPVLIAGVEVGAVRRVHERTAESVRVRYHASLQLGDHQSLPATFPLQVHGWADEPEQAVKNAVHAYRAGFRRALDLLDDLDEQIRGGP